MGLGFFLVRSGTRTYVGHTGGMPGHITAAVHRPRGAAPAAWCSPAPGPRPTSPAFAITLADLVTDHEPVEPEPWRPGDRRAPTSSRDLVGVWYTEGSPFTFSVRAGTARGPRAGRCPSTSRPRASSRSSRDLFRTVAGREAGRAAAGHPRRRRPCHAR